MKAVCYFFMEYQQQTKDPFTSKEGRLSRRSEARRIEIAPTAVRAFLYLGVLTRTDDGVQVVLASGVLTNDTLGVNVTGSQSRAPG